MTALGVFQSIRAAVAYKLGQTTMIWQRRIKKALEPYNISHAQFVIMATLLWLEEHNSNTTQILIVNLSKLDKMTVSKSLKKLAALGLVHRREHETDTRAKTVALTDQGKSLVNYLVPIVEAFDGKFFGKASRLEQQSLIQILKKLTNTPVDI